MAWRFEERDARLAIALEIAREIVGLEEQENAATALVAYRRALAAIRGSCEQDCCFLRARGSNNHPALPLAEVLIIDKPKAESAYKERKAFLVGGDEQRDGGKELANS